MPLFDGFTIKEDYLIKFINKDSSSNYINDDYDFLKQGVLKIRYNKKNKTFYLIDIYSKNFPDPILILYNVDFGIIMKGYSIEYKMNYYFLHKKFDVNGEFKPKIDYSKIQTLILKQFIPLVE